MLGVLWGGVAAAAMPSRAANLLQPYCPGGCGAVAVAIGPL